MEKYIISKLKNEIHFLKKNKDSFCQCGNWPLGMVIGNTWFHLSHLEKLTALFCHIFFSRAIFPCVLSIGDKHKGNFLKSSLRWGRMWSHMLGLTISHKFMAFARIGIWGLTFTSLLCQWLKLVKPMRGCRMPHTRKLRTWKTANGNDSMLTDSWLPSHTIVTIVGNTCTVALTRLHPVKSSTRATVLVLAIRNNNSVSRFLITVPHDSHVGNTCTVALTRLHPVKSSTRATVLVLAIRNNNSVSTVQRMNLGSFGIQ